jgi:hypothetical protein
MGTVVALTKNNSSAKKLVTEKVQGNKKTFTEAEIFNRPRPEIKPDTPEQKAATEKKLKEIESHRATQPMKKNHHPDLVLHKNGPLTEEEKQKLKHARTAAIADSKIHQIHLDESKSFFVYIVCSGQKFWSFYPSFFFLHFVFSHRGP